MRKNPAPQEGAIPFVLRIVLHAFCTMFLGTAMWIVGGIAWQNVTGQKIADLPDTWRPFVIPIPFIVTWLLVDAPTRRLIFGDRRKDDRRPDEK